MKFSHSYALALGAALLATPAWPASLAPNTCDPRATAQAPLGASLQSAPRAERRGGTVARVGEVPSTPATPRPVGVFEVAPPAVPALPATPCPPAACAPLAAVPGFGDTLDEQDAPVARGLSGVIYTTDDDGVWVASGQLEAAQLAGELRVQGLGDAGGVVALRSAQDREASAESVRAAELQVHEYVERARASAAELETNAVELQKHAVEMEQRAYAEQGRARARAESEAARASAEVEREALDAVRGGALGRTSWRVSTQRNPGADRSLEERVARLEALANERFPGRDRADSGSRSLEARVAELEALLLGGARTPAPSPSAPERARARVVTPDVYSYDAQRGTLRKLPSGAEDRTFPRAPASGGGGSSGFAPRARQDREHVTRAPETEPAPATGGGRDEQRAEVERRMIELREQLAKLREQMNGMRAELEALPRRDD